MELARFFSEFELIEAAHANALKGLSRFVSVPDKDAPGYARGFALHATISLLIDELSNVHESIGQEMAAAQGNIEAVEALTAASTKMQSGYQSGVSHCAFFLETLSHMPKTVVSGSSTASPAPSPPVPRRKQSRADIRAPPPPDRPSRANIKAPPPPTRAARSDLMKSPVTRNRRVMTPTAGIAGSSSGPPRMLSRSNPMARSCPNLNTLVSSPQRDPPQDYRETPVRYQASYDHCAEGPDQKDLTAGDIVVVTDASNPDWLRGYIESDVGNGQVECFYFPSNCLEPANLEDDSFSEATETTADHQTEDADVPVGSNCFALKEFLPTETFHGSLVEGDVIKILGFYDADWIEGCKISAANPNPETPERGVYYPKSHLKPCGLEVGPPKSSFDKLKDEGPYVFSEGLPASLPRYQMEKILPECCSWMMERGLREEGVFRVPASLPKVQATLSHYNEGRGSLSGVLDPIFVSGLIKLWIRKASDPIIPASIQFALEEAAQAPEENRGWAMATILSLFCPERLQALAMLFDVLRKISENSKENKMTKQNLAKVIGPSLMPRMTVGAATNVAIYMLRHPEMFM